MKLKISLVFSAGKSQLVGSLDLLSVCKVAIGVPFIPCAGLNLGENFFGFFLVVADNTDREDLVLGKESFDCVILHNLFDSFGVFQILYVKLSFKLRTVVIVTLN